MDFTRWRMAGKYGYRRDLITDAFSHLYSRLWYCTLRRKHQIKMQSYGRCIRCGKLVA